MICSWRKLLIEVGKSSWGSHHHQALVGYSTKTPGHRGCFSSFTRLSVPRMRSRRDYVVPPHSGPTGSPARPPERCTAPPHPTPTRWRNGHSPAPAWRHCKIAAASQALTRLRRWRIAASHSDLTSNEESDELSAVNPASTCSDSVHWTASSASARE
jgi:hypothetical protein